MRVTIRPRRFRVTAGTVGISVADTAHTTDTDNPHSVTKAQVGLGNVDNLQQQPFDLDLTTIAGLDSATAGALVTDGAGWIRKTYAQLKAALELVKADVGLGNVDNTSDADKPVSTAQAAALALKADAEGLADSGWILPTLATDITVGPTWQHLGYRKVSGIVHVVVNVLIADPAIAKVLFTLPAGFRWGPGGTTAQIGFVGLSNSVRVMENGVVRAHTASNTITVAFSYPAGG